jgi:hypothetical protein
MKNAAWLVLLFAALCAGQTFPSPGPNSPYPSGGSVVTIPSASPAGGSYIYVSVGAAPALTSVTSGASIVYTVDGSTPTVSSGCTVTHGTLLSNGGSLSTFYVTTTVKALGCKAGMTPSSVASLAYTLSSLVAEWPMENGSGTTATDSCCGDNLTITAGSGSWSTQSGVANGVYSFDGVASTGTRMDAANYTNLNFNYNQPFSIFAVFVSTNTGAGQQIIGRENTASNYQGWGLHLNYINGTTLQPDFELINSYPTNALEVSTAATYTTDGTLYDVLVTYDGTHDRNGVKLYINGSNISSTNTAHNSLTTTTTNTKNPRVGVYEDGTTYPFKGKMGPVYVWNRVLTSGEATALHSNFYNVPN